jgi:hypothetical protein
MDKPIPSSTEAGPAVPQSLGPEVPGMPVQAGRGHATAIYDHRRPWTIGPLRGSTRRIYQENALRWHLPPVRRDESVLPGPLGILQGRTEDHVSGSRLGHAEMERDIPAGILWRTAIGTSLLCEVADQQANGSESVVRPHAAMILLR